MSADHQWRAFARWLDENPPDPATKGPWHYFGDPTWTSPAWRRLATENPALLPLLEAHGAWGGALTELVQTGATADDIERGEWIRLLDDFALQRWLAAALARLRGEAARAPRAPSDWTLQMISKISEAYRYLVRTTGRPPSRVATARRVGIDRGTIAEWVKKGWMSWPPREKDL